MPDNDNMDIYAIVVAAGSGTRFGSTLPKQFCLLRGVPVVVRAIRGLRAALPGVKTVIVVSPSAMTLWDDIAGRWPDMADVAVAAGGDTRWRSVKNGLELVGDGPALVLIHDGARPIVDAATVGRVVSAALAGDGAVPVTQVTDSLRMVDADGGSCAVDRAAFRAVQTPQAFDADKLRRAYAEPYSPQFTDDASVMAAAGFTALRLVQGSTSNIKITHPLDLDIAGLYLDNPDRRQ
jgi:2-C-methyl-D-erythritol 4-phosphate cytidylyltransferase